METVISWGQFSGMFMCLFQGARKYATPLSCLASIKQGPNETLKAYIKRFNDELATIHNPQENRVIMAAISRVQPETPFSDKLQKDECKSLQEFYRRADKIIWLETTHELYKQESPLPQRKTMTSARSGKIKIVVNPRTRQTRRQRPLI